MRLLIVLVCWSFSFFLSAQSTSPFLFRNITINEGLSQNSVISAVADETGFIWFATQDGLNRFDGKEFVILKKSFDDITTSTHSRLGKIIPASTNKLWMITTKGKLEALDLLNYNISPVTQLPGTNFSVPVLHSLLIDKNGNVWLGTETEGIIQFNCSTKKLTHFPIEHDTASGISNTVYHMYEDAENNIWAATGKGICFFNNSGNVASKKYWVTDKSQAAAFSAITQDSKGNMWAGTYGNGIYFKKKQDSFFLPFKGLKDVAHLSKDLVTESLLADEEGQLWIGTYGKGLLVHNISDSSTRQFLNDKSNAYSIGFNDILDIYKDKQGGIWLGTDGGGVSYYNKQLNNFNLIANSNVPENISVAPVRSITTDQNGLIWLGTSSKGFTSLDLKNKKYASYYLQPYNAMVSNSNRVVSLLADANDIWIGTQGNGLVLFDSKTRKNKKWFYPQANSLLNIPDNTIWCMAKSGYNTIWAGTQSGRLLQVDKEKGLLYDFALPPEDKAQTADAIRCFASMGDSILLIAQENGGVHFFNLHTLSFIAAYAKLNDAMRNKRIILKCIFYSSPYICIGTLGNGLFLYNTISGKLTALTEEDGLPNNTVYGIMNDDKDNLWISTNKGICSFTLSALQKSGTLSLFKKFTVADGLQGNEFNTGAYAKAPDGTLLFGGINGFNFFKPENFSESPRLVKVAVTNIAVDNIAVAKDTMLIYKKLLDLSYQYRSVSFRFAVLDFASVSRYSYFYQMVGYDKQWVESGSRNFTTYTNLPAGKYTFNIKASIPGSQVETQITSLYIVVHPPFWKKWWFVALLIIVTAFALYSLYRYRLKQALAVQMVRNRIATDLHDDIGSALSNINMLAAIISQKMDDPAEAKKYLKRINEEVNTSSQSLDDIIWSIDTRNDTLEETISRMRRFAAELFEANDHIKCELDFDESFSERKLNIEQRRDIFLVYKEALNNIYKHADATNVLVKVRFNEHLLYLLIQDDGKGFNINAATHRNGLKNMRSRVEKWGGKLKISSDVNGSRLEAEIPV